MRTQALPTQRRTGTPSCSEELDGVLGDLFRQVRVPLAVLGLDQRIRRANEAFCALVGRAEEELVGRRTLELTHPEDRAASRALIRRLRRGRQVSGLVKRYVHSDGHAVFVLVTTSNLQGGDGAGLGTLVQAQDISAQVQLRQQLTHLDRFQAARNEISREVLRAQSKEELWETTCRVAVEAGGVNLAWIGVLGADGRVVPKASFGNGGGHLEGAEAAANPGRLGGGGPLGRVLDGGHTIFQDLSLDPGLEPSGDLSQGLSLRSAAWFPLKHGARVIGVLAVYSDAINFFGEESVTLLNRITSDFEVATLALEARDTEETSAALLQNQLRRLNYVVERTGVATATLTEDLRFTQVNPALGDLLGTDPGHLVGRTLLDFVPSSQRRRVRRGYLGLVNGPRGALAKLEHELVSTAGDTRWVVASGTKVPEMNPDFGVVLWQAQDVTRQHLAEATANRKSAQQAAVAELGQRALASDDINCLMQVASQMLRDQLGVDKASVLCWNRAHDSFRFVAGVGWDASVIGGALIPGGRHSLAGYTVRSTAAVVSDFDSETRFDEGPLQEIYGVRSGMAVPIIAGDQPYGVLEAFTIEHHEFPGDDIHYALGLAHVLGAALARRRTEAALQQQALHDPLTGLPNRTLLLDRIPAAISRARRSGQAMAVMFLDLDRLKVVNDSLGHSAGDLVLQTVAQRLELVVRPSDTVARVGGDEFVVLAEELGSAQMGMLMARRLVQTVENPIKVGGQDVVVTLCAGVRVADGTDLAADDLLRDADIAMYHAKQGGGRRAVAFTPEMGNLFGDRVKLEADLHRATSKDELVVQYQPLVELEGGTVVGAEALVRWNHPERGLLSPAEFIPLAEETGLILEIGAFVLRQACATCKRWSALLSDRQPLVAVNLSTRQLLDPGIVDMVAATLEDTGLPAALLSMEITETALLANSMAAVSALDALHGLGVQLALDDFGTGYSSVVHLKRFNLDHLKLDKAFVDEVDTNPRDAAIVGGLIQLAHAIGLTAVAEGVETQGQLQALRRLGCDVAQGYLMARPLPEAEFEQLWVSGRSF